MSRIKYQTGRKIKRKQRMDADDQEHHEEDQAHDPYDQDPEMSSLLPVLQMSAELHAVKESMPTGIEPVQVTNESIVYNFSYNPPSKSYSIYCSFYIKKNPNIGL